MNPTYSETLFLFVEFLWVYFVLPVMSFSLADVSLY